MMHRRSGAASEREAVRRRRAQGWICRTVTGVSAVLAMSIGGTSAGAAGIDGAWASSAEACSKIFERRGNRVSLRGDADMYGSGFVVEGNQIRGKSSTCTVRVRKQDGDIVHLVAACSTDVAVDTLQLSYKQDGPDRIIRIYPGLPELDTPYYRCP